MLHDDITLSGMASCVHSPENEWAPWCDVLARRLIAHGATLDDERTYAGVPMSELQKPMPSPRERAARAAR